MHYLVLSLLCSDFIYRSLTIRNLLYFHNFIHSNYNSNFHMMDLDHSHLRFMLSYYIRFRLRSLLLPLVLSYLCSSLHYLYNSSYFMLYHLSLHYMFIHYLLLYMFILLSEFMLHYLYFLLMSLLHLHLYMSLILENMSMFHMLVPSYRMYMSLFL